jgi:hypothetical protein
MSANMLPEKLVGTFAQYKYDTDTFTTWLSKSALALGCQFSRPVTPMREGDSHVKSKYRAPKNGNKDKVEKETQRKYPVSDKELLLRAQVVANNGMAIPRDIKNAVQRAIFLRNKHAVMKADRQNGHSTEGHLHFIEVLEKAVKIKPKPASGTKKPSILPGSALPFLGLSNCFGDLAIEIVEGVEEVSTPAISPPGESKEAAPNAIGNPQLTDSANDTYELDIDSSVDRSFDVFCFFEDLHRIQDFLKEMWNH